MDMYQDGVEVMCLPESAKCLLDEQKRSPLEIIECPIGEIECSGECMYYTEA